MAVLLHALLLAGGIAPAALGASPQPKALYVSDIPVSGGVRLAADIYLPEGDGPFPTVLFRTPYDPRFKWGLETAGRLTKAGYAVVINQCRGRFDSAGEFYPFKYEGADGYACMNWLARQPFCNGQIGTMGASYVGMDQWLLAFKRHPLHKAMFVTVAPDDLYNDIAYPGGAFSLEGNTRWLFMVNRRTDQNPFFTDWKAGLEHLPAVDIDRALGTDMPVMRDFLKHSRDGSFWRNLYTLSGKYDRVACPAFIVGGWNDALVGGVLRSFDGLNKAAGNGRGPAVRCLIGPWDHLGSIKGTRTTYGDVDFGVTASVDVEGLAIKWFDKWLKGVDQPDLQSAPLKYFATGENAWHDGADWRGLETREQRLYLHPGARSSGDRAAGSLTERAPVEEPPSAFTYDPADPVPTITSQHLLFGSGPKFIDEIERRNDVLVFTSEPLTAPTFVRGSPRVVLYIASSAPDTDFTAWLCDVDDSGKSLAIRDGIVRASRYLSRDSNQVISAGQVYRLAIDFGALAHVFKVGHRVRLDISSSNFPAFDRNLNTGEDNYLSASPQKAVQTVYHASTKASALVLPLAIDATAPTGR